MNKIIILNEDVINKIAAGEVIERPASVVKELIENSIDSGADKIEVRLIDGGKKEITVLDNGCGMTKEDAKLALQRYTTSKIKNVEDLQNITTLGFRGEALSSIAAVSVLEVTTRQENDIIGTYIKQQGGNIIEIKEIGSPAGTQVTVKNIFYNTPARLKHLKSTNYELALISHLINIYSICYTNISFKLIHNNNLIYNTQSNDIKTRILETHGREIATNLIEINEKRNELKIRGFISNPNLTRANITYQYFFVNNRFIKNKLLNKEIEEGYRSIIQKGRYPIVFLFIDIPPAKIDVNVHPTKREINFLDNDVFKILHEIIKENLIKIKFPHQIIKKPHEEIPKEIKKVEHPPEIKKESIKLIVEPKYELLTQIDNTYIVIRKDNEILIIDQHALHERIIFEKLLKQKGKVLKQELLIPLSLELSQDKFHLVLDNLSFFDTLGFKLERFDKTSLLIRTTPAILTKGIKEELFLDLIDDIIEELSYKKEVIIDEILGLIACKLAIRKGQKLTEQEIKGLLDDMDIVDEEKKYVFACCHGRPTVYKITKEELDRYFKRR